MSRKSSGRTASGRTRKLRVNAEDEAVMDEVCRADGLNLSDEIRMLFRARAKKLRADSRAGARFRGPASDDGAEGPG